MSVLGKALFKAPPRSIFTNQFSNQISYEMGKLMPIKYFDMNSGDSIRLDFSQLTRFAPLLSPVMHNYKLYVDALFVPYRLLNHPLNGDAVNVFNAEQFFRMDDNPEAVNALMPTAPVFKLVKNNDYLKVGNLGDTLCYPIFLGVQLKLRKTFLSKWWHAIELSIPEAYYSTKPGQSHALKVDDILSINFDDGYPDLPSFSYDGIDFHFQAAPYKDILFKDVMYLLHDFLLSRGFEVPLDTFLFHTFDKLQSFLAEYDSTLLDFQAFIFDYFTYVFMQSIANEDNIIDDENIVNLLPYYCYWRAVGDWYINTNIESTNDFVASHLKLLEDASQLDFKPFNVYYDSDYFTSAFDSPQSGPNVMIPANGSINDLRNASALQSLKERIKYAGTRLIDQDLVRLGVKSRNQQPDRSVVLGRRKFNVNITDIMQTSQGDLNSPLASFAGQGYSLGKDDRFVNFTCDERGMVLVLASLRPTAVYEGYVPKLLFKQSRYDFLNPELASIGEQPIASNELFNGFKSMKIFGYQRRYSEYMNEMSEVHGEFRSSLDFWNSARHFATRPALNQDFLKISNPDDYNRIFAVQGNANHVYSFFFFNSRISRALPRYVNYNL